MFGYFLFNIVLGPIRTSIMVSLYKITVYCWLQGATLTFRRSFIVVSIVLQRIFAGKSDKICNRIYLYFCPSGTEIL